MNNRFLIFGGALLAVVVVLLFAAFFTVYQSQQALILQFGSPIRVVKEPGLHVRIPFVQQVQYFDRRVLDYDAPSVELVLGDQKRLVVDAFVRYRITDPLRFRQSVGTELAFQGRIEPIVYSALRSVLGEVSLFTVLSEDRTALMSRIRDEANQALDRFGVQVVDVRIKRADLPAENSQAIYRRMQTERDREARELRAQGAEIAQRIRARADRERRVIVAEAEKQANILQGEGEGEATTIFGKAFGEDQDFFGFYRSMQAYRAALRDDTTSFVLSPDSEFFSYFNGPSSLRGGGGATEPANEDVAAAPVAGDVPGPTADEAPDSDSVVPPATDIAESSTEASDAPSEVEAR